MRCLTVVLVLFLSGCGAAPVEADAGHAAPCPGFDGSEAAYLVCLPDGGQVLDSQLK